jgi:hypothetical protein
LFNKKINQIGKRQLERREKAMKGFTNSLSKCFCGQPFDQDGVCSNGHLQDEKYFFPVNKLGEKNAKQEDAHKKQGTCEPFASRCNICGTHIPEGDDTCQHGHIVGVNYSNN